MSVKRILGALLALLAFSGLARAETMIMVQGYLGNAGSAPVRGCPGPRRRRLG